MTAPKGVAVQIEAAHTEDGYRGWHVRCSTHGIVTTERSQTVAYRRKAEHMKAHS